MRKRILSLLLAAALCISIMPAYAAEQPDSTDGQMHVETVVNPLYQDVVTQQDIQANTQNKIACYADEPELYFNSIEEAGAYLREKMEVHQPEVSFNIYLDNTISDIDYRDIYDEAIKETGVPTQGDYIRWGCAGYSIAFLVGYDYSAHKRYEKYMFEPVYFATAEQEVELTEAFQKVMQKFDFENKTTYQKIKMLYTYVCSNVKYDYKNLNDDTYMLKYSAYAALVNKTAVCQGYAALMYRMLWQAGVPNRIVASNAHGWNIVKIGDVYYNIDSTWDAGRADDPQYFLRASITDINHQRQDFYTTEEFCSAHPMAESDYQLTAEDLKDHTHTWDDGVVTIPATCVKEGVKTYHCTACTEIKTETIAKAAHMPVIDAPVAPTYTTEGKTEGTHCSVCGEILIPQKIIPALEKPEPEPEPEPTPMPTVSFIDIESGSYYADAVAWAVAQSITKGTSDTTFSPNETCTRGQIVTFLWRAKGEPEPNSYYNPFVDVSSDAYYYKAVLWTVEQGITNGTSPSTFSPGTGCTRGQVATFLWRAEGKPTSSASNPFDDVNTSEYYGTAVLWAVEHKITNGTDVNAFSPNMTCTRGQIVTFLYRAMA